MAIPVARLEQLTSNRTLKEFRAASKMRAVCANDHQEQFDRGANKVTIDIWTDAASSGADPAATSGLDEPTTNVALTDYNDRDANWPTPRKPGIRQVEMSIQTTSLQSNIINWLDERTVTLEAVETIRRHQRQLIKRDVDLDLYTELTTGIPAANALTNAELGVANGPLYDISDGTFAINSTNTIALFGKAIDNYFDTYVEKMTDLGAMDGDSDSESEDFYAHMNIRTWHFYEQYLETKNIIPEQQRALLKDDRYLGEGMAVMVRKGIKLLINRQVALPTSGTTAPLIVSHGRSAVQVADIPGVTSLFTPRTNPNGPHWLINQAAALAKKKADPRTVYRMDMTVRA